MKGIVLWLAIWAVTSAQAAGFYELDSDWNSPGKQVTTVTMGGSVGQSVPMFILDSTGYYEGFVGYPMKLGLVSVTPHLGLEGLKNINPKGRGLIVANAKLGLLSVMTVNEFGGVTGNFHKERLWIDAGSFGFGLVRHRFAGFGPRIDYRLSNETTLFLQFLRNGDTSRLTFAVSGTF